MISQFLVFIHLENFFKNYQSKNDFRKKKIEKHHMNLPATAISPLAPYLFLRSLSFL